MANNPRRGGFEKLWTVPTRGVLHQLPIYKMPDDGLFDSLNVIVRQGLLVTRPGLTQHSATSLMDRPMGAFANTTLSGPAFQLDAFQNDAFQIAGVGGATIPIVGTTRKIWAYYSGNWVDITDVALTGTEVDHVRMAGIEISGVIWTIIVNGRDAMRQWNQTTATVAQTAGSPPTFFDVANISNHIVGLVKPFTVRWGNNLDLSTWPTLNFRDVSDTPDPGVAIRNLGTLAGVLYKEKTIWSILPVGGTEAGFFRFELRGYYDGPVSPAAIVESSGVNYHMTRSGRVGMFTGTNFEWVADGVWSLIRDDLDTTNSNRIFGIYEPLFDEVYFFYPRVGDGGELKGGVCIIRPRPQDGIYEHIAFPIRLTKPVSCGTDLRLENNKALLFRSDNFRSTILEGASDDGGSFTGFWQQGLVAMPGLQPHRLEEIEVFAHRGVNFGSLSVKPVYSNILDTHEGTLGSAVTVDLTDASAVRDIKGQDVRGRFMGLRYEFTTAVDFHLHFFGSRITAGLLEPPTPGR